MRWTVSHISGSLLAGFLVGCGGPGLTIFPNSISILGLQSGRSLAIAWNGPDGLERTTDFVSESSDPGVVTMDGTRLSSHGPGLATISVETPEGTGEVIVEVLDRSPFAARLETFDPGPGAGFGVELIPGVVLGPPKGGGLHAGSFDVLSLGAQGRIELAFDGVIGVDGPGPDIAVFENAFEVAGSDLRFIEPGSVQVLEADGWVPVLGSAGKTPVLAGNAEARVDARDSQGGGDRFDLPRATGIRGIAVTDDSPDSTETGVSAGFDLDAVMLLNALPSDTTRLVSETPAFEVHIGDSFPLPRVDAEFPGGSMFGVETHWRLEGARDVLNADCEGACEPIFRALKVGRTTLIAELGAFRAETKIEVLP